MSDFWWGLIVFIIYIPLIFLWGFAFFDLFTRHDLNGWSKILWAFGILLVPFIGVLVYFLVRPRDYAWADSEAGLYAPGPSAAPSRPSGAVQDIDTLSRLHDSGTLSDEEFNRLKNQVLAT